MSDDAWAEDFEHPVLGVFRMDGEAGWAGRRDHAGDFFDLYVMRPAGYSGDHPPAACVDALAGTASRIEAVFAEGVASVCAARTSRLNWREGPPPADWSVIELRADPAGDIWISLHENVTDEYSLWMLRIAETGPWIVKRRAYTPSDGPPGEIGEAV